MRRIGLLKLSPTANEAIIHVPPVVYAPGEAGLKGKIVLIGKILRRKNKEVGLRVGRGLVPDDGVVIPA